MNRMLIHWPFPPIKHILFVRVLGKKTHTQSTTLYVSYVSNGMVANLAFSTFVQHNRNQNMENSLKKGEIFFSKNKWMLNDSTTCTTWKGCSGNLYSSWIPIPNQAGIFALFRSTLVATTNSHPPARKTTQNRHQQAFSLIIR